MRSDRHTLQPTKILPRLDLEIVDLEDDPEGYYNSLRYYRNLKMRHFFFGAEQGLNTKAEHVGYSEASG